MSDTTPATAGLTSSDPEPPVGTVVRDALGRPWVRTPTGWDDSLTYWLRTDIEGDPESWVKVAGNYGPVEVLGA